MYTESLSEIFTKLQCPLRSFPFSERKKIVSQITYANYYRLKFLLHFFALFALVLIGSDILQYTELAQRELFPYFLAADIILFTTSAIGLFIFYRKKLPGIPFQKRYVLFYLFFSAFWIGFISGLDYNQNFSTLIAGLFIISGVLLINSFQHTAFLFFVFITFLTIAYMSDVLWSMQSGELMYLFFSMILTSLLNKLLYKNKIDAFDKELQLQEYAENLEVIVQKRTADIKTKNENLIKEINSKETIQNQLIASEELFKKLLYQSADAIAIFETNGSIVHWNTKTETYIGITKEEAVNKDFWKLFAELPQDNNDGEPFKEKVDKYIKELTSNSATSSQLKVRHWVTGKSKISRYLETKIFPIHLHKKILVGAISRNVTQQLELEKHLTSARQKAEKANLAKSEFLANISHDLRAPLNSISGFSQILKLKPKMPKEKVNKYLDIIYTNGQYLLQLINGLIDLSKIQSGNVSVNNEEINIQQFIQETIALAESEKTLRNTDVKIETHCQTDTKNIISDRTKLLQIFTNLLSNAIKFTDKGAIKFGCKIENSVLNAYVEDTGEGMSEAELKNIFTRFYTKNGSNNHNKQGKGLGLPIVKGYIDLLGGNISVKSTEGEGTRFDFAIPVQPYSEEIKTEGDNLPVPGKNVLIADNNAESAEIVAEILDQYQLIPMRVKKLEDILQDIKGNQIDLVLIDIYRESQILKNILKQIKKMRPDLPIIAYTALSKDNISDDMAGLLEMIVFKPLDGQFLIRKLARFLHE